ncbi:hypothetical protein BgiBS90_028110 [Biomphalaria glabrata]|nr:hypothetical protein BgiBS90_028110 [Biomphalaria glabrata]
MIILVLLMLAQELQSTYIAEFKECDGSLLRPIIIASGTSRSLCCFKNGCTSDSDELHIYNNTACQNLISIHSKSNNSCSSEVEILTNQNEDNCEFVCTTERLQWNRSAPYDRCRVATANPLGDYEMVRFQYSEEGTLDVTISSKENFNQVHYKYQLTVVLSNGSKVQTTTNLTDKTRDFIISISPLFDVNNVDVYLTVNKSVFVRTFNTSINLLSHIVPGCVENLSLETDSLTSTKAVIKFHTSQLISSLVPIMANLGKPLMYHIILYKMDGIKQTLQLTLNKTVFNDPHSESQQSVAVLFNELVPYMNYIVSVQGEGGGGQGCLKNVSFTTSKEAPAAPPEQLTFSRNNGTGLTLMWKSLGRDLAGGSNISYDIEITSTNSDHRLINTQSTFLEVLTDIHKTTLGVKIWSRNEIGQSENLTKIDIDLMSEPSLNKVRMVIDFLNQTSALALTNLDLPSVASIQNLSIHWCVNMWTSSYSVCQEYPQTSYVPRDHWINGYTSQLFHYNLSETMNEVTTDSVGVSYYEMNNQSFIRTVTAVRTTTRSAAQGQGDCLTNCQSTANKYPQVFYSIKFNTSWTGMIPADCYYSRQIKDARFNYELHNSTNLVLEQNCSQDKPLEFLIKLYKVYPTQDGDCQLNKPLESWQTNRSLFSQTVFTVPANQRLLCIQALGDDGLASLEYGWISIPPLPGVLESTVDRSIIWIIVISIVALLVCGGLFSYSCYQKCKIRRQLVFEWTNNQTPDSPDSLHMTSNDASLDSGHVTNSDNSSSDNATHHSQANSNSLESVNPTSFTDLKAYDLTSDSGICPSTESPKEYSFFSQKSVLLTSALTFHFSQPNPVESKFLLDGASNILPSNSDQNESEICDDTSGSPSQPYPVNTGSNPSQPYPVNTGSNPSQPYPGNTGSSSSQSYPVNTGSSPSQPYPVNTGSSSSQSYPVNNVNASGTSLDSSNTEQQDALLPFGLQFDPGSIGSETFSELSQSSYG